MQIMKLVNSAIQMGGSQSTAEARVHVVQRGQTLVAIARSYGIDAHALIAANPAVLDSNALYPGERLNLPADIHLLAGDTGSVQKLATAVELNPVREFAPAGAGQQLRGQETHRAILGLFEAPVDRRPDTPGRAVNGRKDVSQPHPLWKSPASASGPDARLRNLPHKIPMLSTHVPQGMTTLEGRNGRPDMLLITAYPRNGKGRNVIIAVDAVTGKQIATVKLPPLDPEVAKKNHQADSIAIAGNTVLVQTGKTDAGNFTGFELGKLRDAISQSRKTQHPVAIEGGHPIKIAGSQVAVSDDGKTLYSTSHVKAGEGQRPSVHVYSLQGGNVINEGKLDGVKVPYSCQGIVSSGKYLIFSKGGGKGAGEVVVIDKTTGHEVKSIKVASLPEGVAILNGKLHIVYESGSPKFHTHHPSRHIQVINLNALA